MEEIIERRPVLTAEDLHLLMQTTGAAAWNDIPLAAEAGDLDELMLSSFLRLVEEGLIVPSGPEKYRVTEEARELILPLKEPERKTLMLIHGGTAILYEKCGQQRVLLADPGGRTFRLGGTEDGAEELLSQLGLPGDESCGTEETPTEIFSPDSDPNEIMKRSEALFIQTVRGGMIRRCARVFAEGSAYWLSVPGSDRAPERLEKEKLLNWIRQGEATA